jgi:hypothetical protein
VLTVNACFERSVNTQACFGFWRGCYRVMSDWFGTYSTGEALEAGLDLEMLVDSRLSRLSLWF